MKWIAYSLWHTLIIFCCVEYALAQYKTHAGTDGKDVGFWISGMTVFGSCVWMANVVILMKFNSFDAIGVFWVAWGLICFFIQYVMVSNLISDNDIYHMFLPNFSITMVWVTILFCVGYAAVEGVAIRNLKHLQPHLKIHDGGGRLDSIGTLDYHMMTEEDVKLESIQTEINQTYHLQEEADESFPSFSQPEQYQTVQSGRRRTGRRISTYAFSQYEKANIHTNSRDDLGRTT